MDMLSLGPEAHLLSRPHTSTLGIAVNTNPLNKNEIFSLSGLTIVSSVWFPSKFYLRVSLVIRWTDFYSPLKYAVKLKSECIKPDGACNQVWLKSLRFFLISNHWLSVGSAGYAYAHVRLTAVVAMRGSAVGIGNKQTAAIAGIAAAEVYNLTIIEKILRTNPQHTRLSSLDNNYHPLLATIKFHWLFLQANSLGTA